MTPGEAADHSIWLEKQMLKKDYQPFFGQLTNCLDSTVIYFIKTEFAKPFLPSACLPHAHTSRRRELNYTHKPCNPALLTNKSSCYLSTAAASLAVSFWNALPLPLLCTLAWTITDWLSPTTAARTPQPPPLQTLMDCGRRARVISPWHERIIRNVPPRRRRQPAWQRGALAQRPAACRRPFSLPPRLFTA